MKAMLGDLSLPQETADLLTRFGFDAQQFERLQRQLASGQFGLEKNRLSGDLPLRAPSESDLLWIERADAEQRAAWHSAGQTAIDNGEVAIAVLNGGMATRFGGVVKGCVDVVDDLSFLQLRLGAIARSNPKLPVFIVCSFATLEATAAHLDARGLMGLDSAALHLLSQSISLRLNPDGTLFSGADGLPSPYAPGHGDIFATLAGAAAFQQFRKGGGKSVWIANVDNLGATVDPVVLGAHLESRSHGIAATAEVAQRHAGDAGGAPAWAGDRLQIIEGFRFPDNFDNSKIPVFNTNTLLIDSGAIGSELPLTWFRADKIVDDKPAVQFERLMGEVSAHIPTSFAVVARAGLQSRFVPVKTRDDLTQVMVFAKELARS